MAVTTSKVTYSLKPETVDCVQELALLWGVPKSEVIQRAVTKIAAEELMAEPKETPLEVLLRIQKEGIGLSPEVAEKFKKDVYRERHAWGRKK